MKKPKPTKRKAAFEPTKLAANQERTFKGFGKEKLERIFGPKPKGAKK